MYMPHSPTYIVWNVVTLQTDAWLYGEYRTCAETAAVSRGTSHVTTKQHCKYTTSVDLQKRAAKSYSHSIRIARDKGAVSLLDSAEQRYIKAITNNNIYGSVKSSSNTPHGTLLANGKHWRRCQGHWMGQNRLKLTIHASVKQTVLS